MEASSTPSQKLPKYCDICTLTGKLCPTEYPIPIKEDWSDNSEGETETQEQNKSNENFSDIEDWDGDLERWKNLEVQGLKNNDNQSPQSSPKSTSTPDT